MGVARAGALHEQLGMAIWGCCYMGTGFAKLGSVWSKGA